jgi:hypothetical protein
MSDKDRADIHSKVEDLTNNKVNIQQDINSQNK